MFKPLLAVSALFLAGCATLETPRIAEVMPYVTAVRLRTGRHGTLMDTGAKTSSVRLGFKNVDDGQVEIRGEKFRVVRTAHIIGVNGDASRPVVKMEVEVGNCRTTAEFIVAPHDARTPDILIGRNVLDKCGIIIKSWL